MPPACALPLLVSELWVHPCDSRIALNGSGLIIIHPPYQLAQRMQIWLPQLVGMLDAAGTGGCLVEEAQESDVLSESPAEYGVIGHPVSHSRSPFIHGIFAQQTGQNMVYRLHDVSPAELPTFVMEFWRRGGKGLNVTVPHKISASGMVRAMSERATRAGAVNTLLMDEDGITGDNTDGAGLVRDLTVNLKVALAGARILLVGSGGAARGVVGPLLDESPELIAIAGRSAARAGSPRAPVRRARPGPGLRARCDCLGRLRHCHQCHLGRA